VARSRPPITSRITSTRRSTPGPSVVVSVAVELVSGIVSIMLSAARRPATVHTIVDIFFGLIDESRAASGFAADARIAIPYFVWLRNTVSTIASSGTITRTNTCSLWIVSPSKSQVKSKAVGKAA
jgi:hypothetical protein